MFLNNKNFNIILAGVGGQGQITLKKILAWTCLFEGLDFKASELHGLAQKGGSVAVHLRIGKQVFSPLVRKGGADLILGMDRLETARNIIYANKKTIFLVNDFFAPFFQLQSFSKEEFLKIVSSYCKKIFLTPASEICQQEFKSDLYAGVFLLGYGYGLKLFPFKKESFIKALGRIFKGEKRRINISVFNKGEEYFRNENR